MFVSLKMLKKKAESFADDIRVKLHPLLKVTKLTAATKAAYVNGCVLAAVVCSGKPTEMGRKTVGKIAQSLKVSKADVNEAFSNVGELVSDKEKEHFAEETLAMLKDATVSRYFMSDFKNVLAFSAPLAGEVLELYNYIGMILFETEDWREKMAEGWREEKRKKVKSFRRQQRIEECEAEGWEKDPPDWWDPLPVREEGETKSHFFSRVKEMVERRKLDLHKKFRNHEIDQECAESLMIEADVALDKAQPYRN